MNDDQLAFMVFLSIILPAFLVGAAVVGLAWWLL